MDPSITDTGVAARSGSAAGYPAHLAASARPRVTGRAIRRPGQSPPMPA